VADETKYVHPWRALWGGLLIGTSGAKAPASVQPYVGAEAPTSEIQHKTLFKSSKIPQTRQKSPSIANGAINIQEGRASARPYTNLPCGALAPEVRNAQPNSILLLFDLLELNAEHIELVGVHIRWCFGHQILRLGGLRECDYLADRLLAREQRHDAIDP
jgi:hypothetical protein